MSGDLVLITGATGHLGFRTLRFALEHGYNVRADVRSEAKADKIKSNSVLKAMNKEAQLSFNARIHVLALDPKIAGNQSFLVSNRGQDGMTWDDTKTIIDMRYREYIQDGTLPNIGRMGTVVGKLDIKKTEDTFDFKLASYETCVVSVMDHYLELLRKEKNAQVAGDLLATKSTVQK
ncbi:hypothetical protein LTR56_025258 [Elasticomyces elasticus]|nr:hypothetical protein LTR56_025258 [Elasticomyces elasticus]KAK3646167.1 hypothetical protein LTR22_014379 [Elasticomyces elasticus]KAK4904471.1 hypothetical protein LTR49_026073 [Elasticomyces elasticus]KAK5739734.1 hypothetical protein LTS12_025159 [Elasticomyces elasticus]